jgi:hypothetical protein
LRDGSWRYAGAEELPCEPVRKWCFLGLGVPVKQLRSQRKGMEVERESEREGWGGGGQESKDSAGSAPQSKSWHQMLGKNAAHKESP